MAMWPAQSSKAQELGVTDRPVQVLHLRLGRLAPGKRSVQATEVSLAHRLTLGMGLRTPMAVGPPVSWSLLLPGLPNELIPLLHDESTRG